MPLAIPERRVLELWQSAVKDRADLLTEGKEPLKIVYPGRPNDGRGPDLKDAVIATRRGFLYGDIEIHVNSSDWWAHGHHTDRSYNPVVLHVVYRHDAGRKAILQNGLEIPTLSLDAYAEEQAGRRVTSAFTPFIPPACRAAPGLIARMLDEAGQARFDAKKAAFLREIPEAGPGEALYRGIMTALGYSKNKTPMAELARTVTLKELESIVAANPIDEECIAHLQARLLGAAGLLPSQRASGCPPDEYTERLEDLWDDTGSTPQISLRDWEFFKVRPGNYPTRRIAAMCFLPVRYRQRGMLEGMKAILEEADIAGSNLEKSLAVNAEGYWKHYADFGLPLKGISTALIGTERAAEISINILLPFYAAYAQIIKQPNLEEKTLSIYRHYRAPAENSLERHMRKQLGLKPADITGVRWRQGLLHIYKTLCTQGKCAICPLRGNSSNQETSINE